MTQLDVLRLALLFSHLMLCAFALQRVLAEDWRLLTCQVDASRLRETLRIVPALLAALWATGIGLALIDTHMSWAEFAAKPKLQAKLLCLSVLTLNGWVLHGTVLKRLANPRRMSAKKALRFAALGGISTSSWLFAAFLGIARPLERHASLLEFTVLYATVLATALLTCLVAPKFLASRVQIVHAILHTRRLRVRSVHPDRRKAQTRQTSYQMQETAALTTRAVA